MPIEIRELIIKARVNPAEQPDAGTSAEAADGARSLIEECVEQVLEILKEREER